MKRKRALGEGNAVKLGGGGRAFAGWVSMPRGPVAFYDRGTRTLYIGGTVLV